MEMLPQLPIKLENITQEAKKLCIMINHHPEVHMIIHHHDLHQIIKFHSP